MTRHTLWLSWPRLSNPSLHVVHLVLKLDIGGLERMVVDLAREGLRLGQRVTVA